MISKKAHAAHAASIKPIVGVGETLAERESKQTEKVLDTQVRGSLHGLTKAQMEETILAYEPVWAIGTGKTATPELVEEAHGFIKASLQACASPPDAGGSYYYEGNTPAEINASLQAMFNHSLKIAHITN